MSKDWSERTSQEVLEMLKVSEGSWGDALGFDYSACALDNGWIDYAISKFEQSRRSFTEAYQNLQMMTIEGCSRDSVLAKQWYVPENSNPDVFLEVMQTIRDYVKSEECDTWEFQDLVITRCDEEDHYGEYGTMLVVYAYVKDFVKHETEEVLQAIQTLQIEHRELLDSKDFLQRALEQEKTK